MPVKPKIQVPLWLLALITLSGTFAMHVFVPALPSVTVDLGTTMAAAQLTITVYLLGLAFGQLLYGPISDRFDLVYFSFGTMSSMGAPGITPVSGEARMLAVIEAILG